MLSLCLGLAGMAWATLGVQNFTLAWSHTIEKIRWEEDYLVADEGLQLREARVRGSGAGMEIPQDAIWEEGAWRYRPSIHPIQPLRLARTPEAGDYDLCLPPEMVPYGLSSALPMGEGLRGVLGVSPPVCRSLTEWLGPPDANQPWLELWVCGLQTRVN